MLRRISAALMKVVGPEEVVWSPKHRHERGNVEHERIKVTGSKHVSNQIRQ